MDATPEDPIETLIRQWREVRPDLDPTPMRTLGRVLRIASLAQARADAYLAPFDLAEWQFDVLATLRRSGRTLTPTALTDATMLSSGAMTNRLDRLEAEGWIERVPNPEDRRSVLIRLTDRGRERVDAAVAARFEEAARMEAPLDEREARTLAELLRRIERTIAEEGGEASGG